MNPVYLDWAATAPPDIQAMETFQRVSVAAFANPSSRHSQGREAARILDRARREFAPLVGASAESVYFTSGGTESNNLVLLSQLNRQARATTVVSGIEHSSIYEPALLLKRQGFQVRFVEADPDGTVRPEAIARVLDRTTRMVSVMLVNNETGAIQPVTEIVRAVRDFEKREGIKIHVHSDCVQALGKIPVDCEALGVDSASFSAHKFGSPRGAGALVLRARISPLYTGGGQEGGIRPGTENLAAIAAMVETAQRHVAGLAKHAEAAACQKKILLDGVKNIEGAVVVPEASATHPSRYSPYISCAAFPPLPGEALVRALSDQGYSVSTGSACSTHAKEHSRVLKAMGVGEAIASSAIRISTGYATTDEQIEGFLGVLERELAKWSLPLRR